KPLSEPPVHRETEAFAHFDLFQGIESNNQSIGVLFSSFKLSVLQILLDRLTEEGQKLELYSGEDILIVETNYFQDITQLNNKNLSSEIIPVLGTDWYLKAYIEKSKLTTVLTYITYANSILFFLLSVMLYLFSNRLVNTFSSDFKTIQRLLLGLKNHDMNIGEVHSKLRETEGILSDIQHITEDISASQQQLVKYSHHDDLTGLLNRRGFFQESARCIDLAKRSIESSLILLDLDHFKQMNDTLGHATGDQVLKILASCIKSSSRTVDIATRLGGDEFAVILVSCDTEHALHWYENLSEQFAQQQKAKVSLSNNAKYCSLSAGCSSIEFTDEDISVIVARADKALYTAKNSGRGNFKPYEVN
ncbi:diguanylate cyclase/phosphodiesterase (GGDEF & EAL domains) with PAS/PAC sensor(s), partial [hydrothermal vent metagenome]